MSTAVDYQAGKSCLHTLSPITKMAGALAVLIVSLVFNDYRYLAVVAALVLAAAGAAGLLPRLRPALVGLSVFAFILLIVQVLFYREGEILFYLIPPQSLPVTTGGLSLGAAMALRMFAIVTSFLVLLGTTQAKDIVRVLVEKCKIPYEYALMFTTALRFIPTFLDEARTINQAQQARGLETGGWNPVRKLRAYMPVAVPLTLMSLRKAEYLAITLETRGYGASSRSVYRKTQITTKDYVILIMLSLTVAAAVAAGVFGYGITY